MSPPATKLANEYADYLLDVGGFAISSTKHHRYVSRCFLDHLDAKKVRLRSIQASDIETYIVQASKRLSRASLQQEIAPLRGLLRFLAMDSRVPPGLDGQIDTPRLYQPEQLPRALPWDTVKALLRSIDTTSPIGLHSVLNNKRLPSLNTTGMSSMFTVLSQDLARNLVAEVITSSSTSAQSRFSRFTMKIVRRHKARTK